MLTVAKVTGRVAAGYADYLEGKATTSSLGDYYLKDGERVEAPGRWVSGAGTAGARDRVNVTGSELRELMAVRHPATGVPLRAVGAGGEAVAALDATFSAPKSVSAIWAVGDDELRSGIEAAHERAIDRAVAYSLTEVEMVRRRVDADTVRHVKAVDVIATSWRHTTARAVDGQLPDPQLHSHVLLHAAVRGDGRVVAIDSRTWLVHRRELGAAYRTELAAGLAELGFEVHRGTGRGGRYFEVAGVPQELTDRWSSRGHQIEQAIHERLRKRAESGAPERLSPAEDRLLRVSTRTGKQPVLNADLDREWQATAREIGFGPAQLRELKAVDRPAPQPADQRALVDGLTEFDATFSPRDARAVALERSAGTPIQQGLEVLQSARQQRAVLTLLNGRETTSQHRRTEIATVTRFDALELNPTHPIDQRHLNHSGRALNSKLAKHGSQLSAEQWQALRLACGDRRVVMIEGQAGTGKSTVLQAVALAHQADNRHVIVTSTAGLAAQRLAGDLAEAGVAAPAYSTAALNHAVKNNSLYLGPDSTVIHDEAALASTREQHQLLKAVQESGARLILVGDPQQSQPVGAGGLWPRLEDAARQNNAHVELSTNLRAQDPEDRRDQLLFRQGHHSQALEGYDRRGRIRLGSDQEATEDRALTAAHDDRHSGQSTMVIAQTSNEHLDELNARAQDLRLADGELGEASLPAPGRPYRLHSGDHIQIRRNVQIGDRRLDNGTMATLSRVDERAGAARLRMNDDTEVTVSQAQLQQADARLAYVQHPFPAQGATSDSTHLIVADHPTRDGSYVAITRARQQTHIYASADSLGPAGEHEPTAKLAQIIGRDEPDVPSIATPLAHERTVEADRPTAVTAETPDLDVVSDDLDPAKQSFAARLRLRKAEHTAATGEIQVDDSWGWEP